MSTQTEQAVQSRQVALASRPEVVPSKDNFSLSTTELSPIQDGEILVRNEGMPVDPYMRGRMKESESYVPAFEIGEPLEGGCIGEVIESKNEHFEVGDQLLGNLGWWEYRESDGESVQKLDCKLTPIQAYLGAPGMTGMNAWVGLRRIAKLRPGGIVFVSAASGGRRFNKSGSRIC